MPTSQKLFVAAILLGLDVTFLPGCAFVRRHHHVDQSAKFAPGDQPDKILFEKAAHDITRSRYDVGRLTLQTLINTYPDSEYLSKAKLAIADSYYSEGGTAGLTQAEAEYKDFITFFPTAPEAPQAQFRVGMAHFRLMAKADRDQTEAELAEAELKEFLLKYPDSPVIPRVKSRLRQAQEVLAEGDYWTANYYYTHGAYLAARSRFQEIIDKYPDYSGGAAALYLLGQSLEHLRRGPEAIPYYGRVITNFPLSPYVANAKDRLTAMHQPIPRPTRATLARAQADAANHPHRDLLSRISRITASAPDTSATLHGPVRLGGPQAGQVEVAKGPPTGGAPPGNAAIVVQPVGDASLTTGKPVDPKTDSNEAKPKETAPDKSPPASTAPSEPAKKKSRFHVLKKIIMPS
jgi:outer membrane protein assembly factor BamD